MAFVRSFLKTYNHLCKFPRLLLSYRTTPHFTTNVTPADLLNYQNGPDWVPGVIVEQLKTLTFLFNQTMVYFGWRRHVDQL